MTNPLRDYLQWFNTQPVWLIYAMRNQSLSMPKSKPRHSSPYKPAVARGENLSLGMGIPLDTK